MTTDKLLSLLLLVSSSQELTLQYLRAEGLFFPLA